MLTINKTCVILPANNMQNNQKHNSIKLKTLNHDTVSFNGWFNTPERKYVSDAVMAEIIKAEQDFRDTFFVKLRELCKHGIDDDLSRKVDANSQILQGKSEKKANELFDLIINDPETNKYFKKEAERLKESVGHNQVR